MLACARLGVTHSRRIWRVLGRGAEGSHPGSGRRVVITADGGWRRGKEVRLKPAVDEALQSCPDVQDVIVYQRTGIRRTDDCGPRSLVARASTKAYRRVSRRAARFRASAVRPLHIRHDGQAEGNSPYDRRISAADHDDDEVGLRYAGQDVYWCTADIGWVTGHSYVVYGPLSAGATTVIYEGAPDFPQFDRWWGIVERYRVTIFYTSPTAIRALIRQGEQWPNSNDLSSLRLLGLGR